MGMRRIDRRRGHTVHNKIEQTENRAVPKPKPLFARTSRKKEGKLGSPKPQNTKKASRFGTNSGSLNGAAPAAQVMPPIPGVRGSSSGRCVGRGCGGRKARLFPRLARR